MKKWMIALPLIWSMFSPNYILLADDSVGDHVKEGASDVKKEVKKGVRSAKDKTCEMVNGKMECAAKKLKHKAQNVGDEVKDKLE